MKKLIPSNEQIMNNNDISLKHKMQLIEGSIIIKKIKKNSSNKSQTARDFQVSRECIRKKLQRYEESVIYVNEYYRTKIIFDDSSTIKKEDVDSFINDVKEILANQDIHA